MDETELKAISSHPWEDNLIRVVNFDQLDDDEVIDPLRSLICNSKSLRLFDKNSMFALSSVVV